MRRPPSRIAAGTWHTSNLLVSDEARRGAILLSGSSLLRDHPRHLERTSRERMGTRPAPTNGHCLSSSRSSFPTGRGARWEMPEMHAWAPSGEPFRPVEREPDSEEEDPKALACYGVYLPENAEGEQIFSKEGSSAKRATAEKEAESDMLLRFAQDAVCPRSGPFLRSRRPFWSGSASGSAIEEPTCGP